MATRSGRMRRLVAGAALMPVALVAGLSGSAASLPPQASPVGEEHAHTHGPDGLALDRRAAAPAAVYDAPAPAPWSPSEYDGAVFTADGADLTELATFHAVYPYPPDQPSRFKQYAAMFQADAREASALLDRLYGRGIRFDMRSAAGGGPGVMLDITVVRSKWRARQLSGANQFSLVANELAAKGFTDPDKKYAVWLDAGSKACGQAHLYQDTRRSNANSNEGRTTAIVYRPYNPGDASGGFCRWRTLLHELGHNMGALQSVAPSAFDGAHCNDSAEDTMCYTSATSLDTATRCSTTGTTTTGTRSPCR